MMDWVRLCAVTCMIPLLSVGLLSQSETSDFGRIGHAGFVSTTVTDYQCVGINPANLGFIPATDIFELGTPIKGGVDRRRREWTFTALEGGLSIHSDALDRSGLMDIVFQRNSAVAFNAQDKIEAARAFAERGMRFNADIVALGVAFQTQSYGGFALTSRERLAGEFVFNRDAAKVIFEGRRTEYFDSIALNWNGDTVGYSTNPRNFSDLFNGSTLSMSWYREYGLSYGVKLVEIDDTKLYVGATAKYLEAYAYLQARVEKGTFTGHSALSPFFGINYGKAVSPSLIPGTSLNPVGNGWGLDLGFTIQSGRWSFAGAVVDLGKLTYDGNVYVANDTILNGLTSTGFDSYNLFNEAQKITGDGEFFSWQGLQTTSTVLPTRVKLGASFMYSYRMQFGIDMSASVNNSAGSIEYPIVSVGADYRLKSWCTLSLGLGGSNTMGVFVPVGAMFSLFDGFWEMGLSTRDLVTWFINKRPVVSMVIGVMRFRI